MNSPKTFRSVKLSATGAFLDTPGFLGGVLIGTDGLNNPTLTVFDNNDTASGTELLPTTEFDASALGLNGYTGVIDECLAGAYLELAGVGTTEITGKVRKKGNWKGFR